MPMNGAIMLTGHSLWFLLTPVPKPAGRVHFTSMPGTAAAEGEQCRASSVCVGWTEASPTQLLSSVSSNQKDAGLAFCGLRKGHTWVLTRGTPFSGIPASSEILSLGVDRLHLFFMAP